MIVKLGSTIYINDKLKLTFVKGNHWSLNVYAISILISYGNLVLHPVEQFLPVDNELDSEHINISNDFLKHTLKFINENN